MNAKKDIVRGNEIGQEVCKALGLDESHVYRVILDLTAEKPAIVYVQMYGDSRLLDVDWERGLEGVSVHVLDDGLRR